MSQDALMSQDEFLKKPRISPHYYFFPMEGDRLQCRTHNKVAVFRGKAAAELLPRLIPQLDGTNTISEIAANLEISEENVLQAVKLLNSSGVLEKAASPPPASLSSEELGCYHSQLSFFSQFKADKYVYQEKLKKSRVLIINSGKIGARLSVFLSECGIGDITAVDAAVVNDKDVGIFFRTCDIGSSRIDVVKNRIGEINSHVKFKGINKQVETVDDVAEIIEGHDLLVVCADMQDIALFRCVNTACLKKKMRWTMAVLDGFTGIIGPTVYPYESACYTCYEFRHRANETQFRELCAFEEYLAQHRDKLIDYGTTAPMVSIIASCFAQEIVKLLTFYCTPSIYSNLLFFNFVDLELRSERLFKLPHCPSCKVQRPKPKLFDR
jgi:thiazole/oxazole-forming peptide maturase SagC family component